MNFQGLKSTRILSVDDRGIMGRITRIITEFSSTVDTIFPDVLNRLASLDAQLYIIRSSLHVSVTDELKPIQISPNGLISNPLQRIRSKMRHVSSHK